MATILVIDDEPLIRKIIQETLEMAGYEIYVTGDGVSGLEMFWHYLPNLVIVDMVMPLKGGLEVIQEIHYHLPEQKIYALAGGGDGPERALSAGANDVLVKPFRMRDLLEKVKILMD